MNKKFYFINEQTTIKNLDLLNNNIRRYIKYGSLILYYNPLKHYGRTYISKKFSQKQMILINNYIEILDLANNIYFEKQFMEENPLTSENSEEVFSEENISIINEDGIFYHNLETTYDK